MKTILSWVSSIAIFGIVVICVLAQNSQEPEAFRIKHDDIGLQCYFHRATGQGPFPTILLLQGGQSGGKDMLQIGATLAGSGVNSITFHYRGAYLSEGVHTFEGIFEDVDYIFGLLHTEKFQKKYEIDTTKIIVGGYSFGGGVALTTAANNPRIKYVFGVGATDFSRISKMLADDPQQAEKWFASAAKQEAPEGPVRGLVEALRDWINNPDRGDLEKISPNFKDKKLLLIGGWEDPGPVVEDHLVPFYRALKKAGVQDVEIIVYHTDHSFRNCREQLAADILEWIKEIPEIVEHP
jgi:dipeptidyl aminopeptidase/acylaminoacyl peptidase